MPLIIHICLRLTHALEFCLMQYNSLGAWFQPLAHFWGISYVGCRCPASSDTCALEHAHHFTLWTCSIKMSWRKHTVTVHNTNEHYLIVAVRLLGMLPHADVDQFLMAEESCHSPSTEPVKKFTPHQVQCITLQCYYRAILLLMKPYKSVTTVLIHCSMAACVHKLYESVH